MWSWASCSLCDCLWPGFRRSRLAEDDCRCLCCFDGVQLHTSELGFLPDASLAYSLILCDMSSPLALRSNSPPGPSSPTSTFSKDLIKCDLVHSSIRPTRSVVEIPGVRLTILKRPAALTNR